MSYAATRLSGLEQARESVTYELPLTERMRTFLRLDYLFRQTRFYAEGQDAWHSRTTIGALLETLAILNRGDTRSDVLKELDRQSTKLESFRAFPGVDDARLRTLLGRVEQCATRLGEAGDRFLSELRANEFLSAVNLRSAIPGGTCEFDLPDFKHWSSRPYDERRDDLDHWLSRLHPLEEAVKEVVWLIREGADASQRTAKGGLYEQALEKGNSVQLVRVGLPTDSQRYPEISGSQHRFTVRFREWRGMAHRAEMVTTDVDFLLACC
ncbi:MAG: cell division protein ZapD [Pseudomonadota bacterium]